MIKNRYVAFAIFVILFLILWNVFEYLTGRMAEDGFSLMTNILFPLIVASLCGYVTYLKGNWDPDRKNREAQDEKQETDTEDSSDRNN